MYVRSFQEGKGGEPKIAMKQPNKTKFVDFCLLCHCLKKKGVNYHTIQDHRIRQPDPKNLIT